MNFQWMNQNAACPVVEFHDVRTEKFRADRYLALIENRFAPALTAAGVSTLGQFRVDNHPDRLVLLRGFAGMAARRKARTSFHASPDWTAQRAESASLLKEQQVMLTRSIVPADWVRPIRRDEKLTLVISELRFPEQIGNYHLWLRLLLRKAGLEPLAAFATLEAVNDVPAVPVVKNRAQHFALLPSDGRVPEWPAELRGMLRYAPEILTLQPAFALVW